MRFKGLALLMVISTIVIVYTSINLASANITGTVNITIMPSPPSIGEVTITPETAYADSVMECEAKVSGNNPNDYNVSYNWYVNNELKGTGKQLKGFNANDNLACEVSAYDSLGMGETKTANIKVKSRIAGITGGVVSNIQGISNKSKGAISFVFLVLLISVLIRHHYITTNFKNKKAKDK